jgi:hypothetical protein
LMGVQGLTTQAGRTSLFEGLKSNDDQSAAQTSEDKNSQVYAITSGNRFKVTPIFDPSGQAQRFRFDYVYGNIINDPDGSSGGANPRLPRTESIVINTEAQVSNFEIRELARFESNAKLGLTEHKSGGIPVLNDIPCFRDIPLIGWFKRRGGSSAVVQHTIIFAQSTMYPTIGDIMDVLTQPLPDVEYLGEDNSRLETTPDPPAPTKYIWKGEVKWECDPAAKDACPCKTAEPKASKHTHPAPGLMAVVIEENAPGTAMRTAAILTDQNGKFEVPFAWDARFRYRLLIVNDIGMAQLDELCKQRLDLKNGMLLFATDFKFIPKITLSAEEQKAEKKPVYDSTTFGPVLIKCNGRCQVNVIACAIKAEKDLKIWAGQAVLKSGCKAEPVDVKGYIPAVQVETPPDSCPQYTKGSFAQDGSFKIQFDWLANYHYRLVLLDSKERVTEIAGYDFIPAGDQQRFTLIAFPLPKKPKEK